MCIDEPGVAVDRGAGADSRAESSEHAANSAKSVSVSSVGILTVGGAFRRAVVMLSPFDAIAGAQ